jgi:hypothetical protein
MGASRVHTFLTDRWYDLQVLDVAVGFEAGMGSCRDRVDVVFLADEHCPSGGEEPGHRGRPKACISLCFEPGWRTEDDGTLKLLNYLGVPLPIPDNFDWERRLANRRIAGLFDAPPRPGARNPLRDARPLDSPPEKDAPEPDVPERAPGPESPHIDPGLNASPRHEIGVRPAIIETLTRQVDGWGPSRQVTDRATGGLRPVHQSTRGMGSDCFESTSTAPNPAVPARGTPRQSRRLEDERTQIGLVEASEFYGIPKSVLSKAAAKNPGARGYLPSIRKGRRVFFDREDIQNFSRSRKQMKHRSKQPAKVLDLTSVSRLFRRD